MNPLEPLPRDVTAYETLLYSYITSHDTTLPHPLTYLDEEPAYWAASNGPRTPEEATHILNTPHLLTLLTELWYETPPSLEAIAVCRATPQGSTLLTATGHSRALDAQQEVGDTLVADSIPGPDDFLTLLLSKRSTHHIAVPLSHAAASDDLPLLEQIREGDIDLTAQVRGRAGDFTVTVTADGRGGRFGILQVGNHSRATFVLPLGDGARVTLALTSIKGGIRLAVLPDLASVLAEKAFGEIIAHSVRASDGTTQEVWRDLAMAAGAGSILYTAVADGLR
ncbi:hypothetical protein N798_00235 [Knoellia flava TL1]|uniref:Uncharacterized protein n=2 Tax=Knoellia flava TaxID=913969 RepID=A0A8H9FSV1_9MICO|nr:hypothetical protein [Knoellia flava]KGN36011.1 hypothetical protein N798_00235 [Knoellia flava TL1]GGB81398.1 hypothetical protein GCM10011314_21260 [Knoellia flava]